MRRSLEVLQNFIQIDIWLSPWLRVNVIWSFFTVLRLLPNYRSLGPVKTKSTRKYFDDAILLILSLFVFVNFCPLTEGEMFKTVHLRCNCSIRHFSFHVFLHKLLFVCFLDVVQTFTKNKWPLTNSCLSRISNSSNFWNSTSASATADFFLRASSLALRRPDWGYECPVAWSCYFMDFSVVHCGASSRASSAAWLFSQRYLGFANKTKKILRRTPATRTSNSSATLPVSLAVLRWHIPSIRATLEI